MNFPLNVYESRYDLENIASLLNKKQKLKIEEMHPVHLNNKAGESIIATRFFFSFIDKWKLNSRKKEFSKQSWEKICEAFSGGVLEKKIAGVTYETSEGVLRGIL